MFRTFTLAAVAAASFAIPAFAADAITIEDPYARAAGMGAIAGAAFMTIANGTDEDDRLIAATSDVAERVELHTHLIDANGVARMVEVEDGFGIPAGGTHALERGGDHVMFMGLKEPLTDGKTVTVTLTFERAGELTIEIPVDNARDPMQGMGQGQQHGKGHGMGG